MRKTKIVCTLGPSTDDPFVLEAIIHAGMNTARLNFSHGSHEEHKGRIDALRKLCSGSGSTVAVMLDTKGPEIRIRQFADGPVFLEEGAPFRLWRDDRPGDVNGVSVTYPALNEKVSPGDIILADDGLISFRVTGTDAEGVLTVVEAGGELSNNKSLNLPGIHIPMPALTAKDRSDLLFGIENNIDFVAASFVRSASDIAEIRSFLEENNGSRIRIIAKIENRQGVDNIDEIIASSDGVMVARGDLGVEIPPEEVPLIQKSVVKKCNEAGKPVIIATQMLDSMIRNPRPTRAEATDVANAVLDGADAVMLSGETAAGKYPVEAVETMARIAVTVEKQYARSVFDMYGEDTITNVVSFASCSAANKVGAKAIIAPTESGYTPRMVSKYRPVAMIIAGTPHDWVQRQLCLTRGVIPMHQDEVEDFEETVNESIVYAVKNGYIDENDSVVITSGLPAGKKGNTNTMRVETVNRFILKGKTSGNSLARGKAVRMTGTMTLTEPSIVITDTVNENLVKNAPRVAGIISTSRDISGACKAFASQHDITILSEAADTRLFLDGDTVEIDPAGQYAYRVSVHSTEKKVK